jgi:hypothetical protein
VGSFLKGSKEGEVHVESSFSWSVFLGDLLLNNSTFDDI